MSPERLLDRFRKKHKEAFFPDSDTDISSEDLFKRQRQFVEEFLLDNEENRGKRAQILFESIKEFHDNYSDDLPNGLVGDLFALGEIPHNRYKCRANILIGIVSRIKETLRLINDPKVTESLRFLFEHQFEADQGRLTTKEEIDLINRAMEIILNELKQTFHLDD